MVRPRIGTGDAPPPGRTRPVWPGRAGGCLVSAALLLGPAEGLAGQLVVRDLVFTGGVAMEGYRGNLAAVTVPVIDETERASAAVGEFSAAGELQFFNGSGRSLTLAMDAGVRQFAAAGFELRDYAPREWVGSLDVRYAQWLGHRGLLQVLGRVKGRQVQDRPPMPLFIQPGYGSADGTVLFQTVPIREVRFDVSVSGEWSDFSAPALTPQLDLLDRRGLGTEVGAEWQSGSSAFRIFTGYWAYWYPRQGSFDPQDPFRRDRAVQGGVTWTLSSQVMLQLGLDGIINRSNSRRPEYDALSFRAAVATPLPAGFGLNLFGVLTGKRYFSSTAFARLVPGEEADNASVLYASLSRGLAANLDGAIRFGLTRAETDIGDSYFRRYGLAILLHYRPTRR